VNPLLEGQLLFLSLGLNNLGFFLIALLSGTLSEQLRSLGTELEKKTQDIQVLKDLNALILENMKSGFISIDKDNRILLYNGSASEILEKNIVEGARLNFIMPDLKHKLAKIKKRGSPIEHIYRAKSATKNLLLLVSDIFSDSNERLGSVIIFSDQTEFKRLEEEAKQNEKLAAIGKLAAGIAHEIRNPLASMSGSIQFMAESLKSGGEEEQKLMKIVLKEIDRLNLLVTEFLDFAKPEKSEKQEVDLTDLVQETLDLLEKDERFANDIHLEKELQKSLKIYADKAKIKQVLLNLLINASQAMEESAVKKLKISLKTKGLDTVLSIRDSGCGMSDEVKKRLFEPFHTTKAKGTGLGLAMVHKILDNHKARVEVKSKSGEGTEFKIHFPLL
tara:strand:- start:2714 stop:3883 length:1170 start_codon:yes stop_codon:yes gene_type:complete